MSDELTYQEHEIAILNKEKLHYFEKYEELLSRKCSNCKYLRDCDVRFAIVDTIINREFLKDFSCSLWEKKDD